MATTVAMEVVDRDIGRERGAPPQLRSKKYERKREHSEGGERRRVNEGKETEERRPRFLYTAFPARAPRLAPCM